MLPASWTPFAGGTDAFVAHFDMLPRGAVTYESSTPACAWPIYQGVNGMPARTNASFAAHVCGAPPNGVGATISCMNWLTETTQTADGFGTRLGKQIATASKKLAEEFKRVLADKEIARVLEAVKPAGN